MTPPPVRGWGDSCARTGLNAGCTRRLTTFWWHCPQGTPECLIVDVEMPDMTGLELQRELSRLGAAIPTIVITGRDSYRDQCRVLGASAYLLKPVAAAELMSAIDCAVGPGSVPA